MVTKSDGRILWPIIATTLTTGIHATLLYADGIYWLEDIGATVLFAIAAGYFFLKSE